MKLNIHNQSGEIKGQMEVSEKIFAVKPNPVVINEAVVAQMANSRQVLAHTKNRSEVRGGGRKPWQQKGTGRARAGSSRSPLWIGGGIIFGPRKDRNFSKKINQKTKDKAMFMVLSDHLENGRLLVLENLSLNEYKTKIVAGILNTLEAKVLKVSEAGKKGKIVRSEKRDVLFLNGSKDEKVKYSFRNLDGVKVINPENINVVDLLKYKNIILTEEAVKKIEATFGK